MSFTAELHNRLATELVDGILRRPIEAGGQMSDIMLLLESVIVGVVGECAPSGTEATFLDAIVSRAKVRLATPISHTAH